MRKIFQFILKLIHWNIIGELDPSKKFVLIVAPHTSNLDFFIGLFAQYSLGIRCRFVAKHQLFFFPLGSLLRFLGGISINRSIKNNFVDEAVDQFEKNKELILVLTPEGTRGQVARWKTGFYHIAINAKVPIALVGFDYSKKNIMVKMFQPTGDMKKDFIDIFAFYRDIHGRFPSKLPDHQ